MEMVRERGPTYDIRLPCEENREHCGTGTLYESERSL